MAGEPAHKNIMATVRPPRCAIFINRNSKYWQAAADGAIAKASEVWGGRHFLIVPTDGATIADKYWELLEAYSPDHLAVYNLSFSELEHVDPGTYKKAKERYRKDWMARGNQIENFEESFSVSASQSRFDELEVQDALQEELLYRLSPFHHSIAIDHYLTYESGFGYPFTKITKIVSAATNHVGQVIVPKIEGNSTLSLLVHSQTGFGSDEYRKEMDAQGFTTRPPPDDYNPLDLLAEMLGEKQLFTQSVSYARNVPFSVNMLHLGQYYRTDRHHAHKEPIIVVLGDMVDDFCFYYSLSRMHEGVVWLPLAWLRDLTAALNSRQKLHAQGSTTLPPLSQTQEAARRVMHLAQSLIKHGYSSKRIKLCSLSLRKSQLIAYKSQMVRHAINSTRLAETTDCVDISSVSTSCTLNVFEQDNYVNHRSMVFIDGKSVSPFETPRPKNFSEIRLPDHYWLTSLQIEGYQPPSVPTLGPEVVKLGRGSSTTESRVANDGIVYQCPSAMIFSADLDAVLVRPKIEMPDVMALFNSYFENTGITVQYSDKGKYFLDTLRRFGGLDELGKFIKSPGTRSILEKFTWDKRQAKSIQSSTKDGERGSVIYLNDDQDDGSGDDQKSQRRCYLNLNAFALSMGSRDAAAKLIDELIGQQVIERGYIFHCQRCDASAWYKFDSLSNEFTCNRCSLRQQFTVQHWKEPVEPHWYYRLAETVRLFYVKNSHLTAQVLYKLMSQSSTAFHYAPEIDLINFPGDRPKREMDVACILDGQIVFGECKTGALKLKDADKFETLARMPIRTPARVVFATTQNVSEEFKKRMGRVPNAELMMHSDLYDD